MTTDTETDQVAQQWADRLLRDEGIDLNARWTTPRGTAATSLWRACTAHLSDGTRLAWDPDEHMYSTVRRDGDRRVAVARMLFNYRVVTYDAREPMTLDGGWCYFGTGPLALARALLAARRAVPGRDGPEWYDKRAF